MVELPATHRPSRHLYTPTSRTYFALGRLALAPHLTLPTSGSALYTTTLRLLTQYAPPDPLALRISSTSWRTPLTLARALLV